MGAIYIFCFLNTTTRRSARKLKKYYSVTWAEDTVFILLWYVKMNAPTLIQGDRISHPWVFGWVAIIYYSAFVSGVSAMVFYYKRFHPAKKSQNTYPLDIQYFDSNLDLVSLKDWTGDHEEAVEGQDQRQTQPHPSPSPSNTSCGSTSSEAQNYATVQHFYTSTYARVHGNSG
jgi:hypothetical protein